ncbi:hypothetical protein H2203_006361 [Taxawa tesnikishii (nom. ined.)]|nr:hypothetical protein H2203_006361 [Dothideales sp. JES 119]
MRYFDENAVEHFNDEAYSWQSRAPPPGASPQAGTTWRAWRDAQKMNNVGRVSLIPSAKVALTASTVGSAGTTVNLSATSFLVRTSQSSSNTSSTPTTQQLQTLCAEASSCGKAISTLSTSTTSPTMSADTNTKPAEHNWANPVKLDYETFSSVEPTWASNAAVYAFRGDEGDVGERNPHLEEQLFRLGHQTRAGPDLDALEFEVTIEATKKINPVKSFDDAGLHPVVRENLSLSGYDRPTVVQAYCIPAVLEGYDVVAVAQTGSGKTAAYLVPITSKLMGKINKIGGPRVDTTAPEYNPDVHRVRAEPLVVIVCPTRELAHQVFDFARRITYRSRLRPVCTYGGVPLKDNIKQLEKGCDILIATPGRLCDLMDRPQVLSLNRVKFTIIDEADEMLQADWEAELGKIMSGGDTNEDADHVYMMFSATFPKEARSLARQYMAQDYVRVRVGRAGSSHKNVKQNIVWVESDSKKQATYDLLTSMEPTLTMIFCNSIRTVEDLDDFLYNKELPTTFIHSGRTQHEREDAMRMFVTGKTPILIATGISARGIDVKNVKTIINYDLPSAQHGGINEYVHRIGRTGRIGHVGAAFSWFNDRDAELGPALVNLLLETEQEVPEFLEQFKPEGARRSAGGGFNAGGVDAGGWGAGPATDASGWGASAADSDNKVAAW